MSKRQVSNGIRVNAYEVMSRVVEQGVDRGWRRAHKHTDTPDPAAIRDDIAFAVMEGVCEIFDFGERHDG